MKPGDKVIISRNSSVNYLRGDVGGFEGYVYNDSAYVELERNGRVFLDASIILPYSAEYHVSEAERRGCRHTQAELKAYVGSDLSRRMTEVFKQKHPSFVGPAITNVSEPELWKPIDPRDVYRQCTCLATWNEQDCWAMWDITALVTKKEAKIQEPWLLNDSAINAEKPDLARLRFTKQYEKLGFQVCSFVSLEQWQLNLP